MVLVGLAVPKWNHVWADEVEDILNKKTQESEDEGELKANDLLIPCSLDEYINRHNEWNK